MYRLTKSTATVSKLSLSILSLLLLAVSSCSDVIISTPSGSYTVSITTDPAESRVVLESMGSRQVRTAISPATFSYVPRPGMPTVVTVSKDGYQSKKVRLTPETDQLHVVLEKVSPYRFQGGGRTGGRMGGGMGGMGRPSLDDIPGVGGVPETTPEDELDQ